MDGVNKDKIKTSLAISYGQLNHMIKTVIPIAECAQSAVVIDNLMKFDIKYYSGFCNVTHFL